MHLIENYSAVTRLAIHKPEIYLQFCPIPCDKYITIQTAGAMLAKNYYFFQEIIDLILPILQKNDIKIVQLGGKNEQKLNYFSNNRTIDY